MNKIPLSFKTRRPILACGADMKGAFALAKGNLAFLTEGFGDLGELDNFVRYEDAIRHAERKFNIKPAITACDMHPGYFSSSFAEGNTLIQHHEAHIASVIAEHSMRGDVIGVAFDGTGYGSDGNIWGGEFFVGNLKKLERVGHLKYVPMPGGEASIREPWRMAASYLYSAFGNKFLDLKIDFVKKLDRKKWPILKNMIDKGINSPITSSAGRLFDGVGSLILSRYTAEEEAQIPIELERLSIKRSRECYDFDIRSKGGVKILDCSEIIRGVVKDISKGIDKAVISAKFHNTIVEMIVKMAVILRSKFKINKIVLSGGVFQNNILRNEAWRRLKEKDFDVYLNSKVPTNDSGISVGQVAIANARA